MTVHQRIRPFNTRDTYPGQDLDNDLCQVVRAGNLVFLRGQVGTDFDGNLVGLGDPEAQTAQAMRNVEQLLAEAGSEMAHVCKVVIYITDRAYRTPVYRELGRWFKGVYPVFTGLIVQGLAQPQWLVEVDVTAVIPD